MKKEIVIIDGMYKLVETGLDWQVHQFKKGGKECRNPATGEVTTTKDKWVGMQAYFPKGFNLKNAINYIINLHTNESLPEISDLKKVLEVYTNVTKSVEEKIDNGLL